MMRQRHGPSLAANKVLPVVLSAEMYASVWPAQLLVDFIVAVPAGTATARMAFKHKVREAAAHALPPVLSARITRVGDAGSLCRA